MLYRCTKQKQNFKRMLTTCAYVNIFIHRTRHHSHLSISLLWQYSNVRKKKFYTILKSHTESKDYKLKNTHGYSVRVWATELGGFKKKKQGGKDRECKLHVHSEFNWSLLSLNWGWLFLSFILIISITLMPFSIVLQFRSLSKCIFHLLTIWCSLNIIFYCWFIYYWIELELNVRVIINCCLGIQNGFFCADCHDNRGLMVKFWRESLVVN